LLQINDPHTFLLDTLEKAKKKKRIPCKKNFETVGMNFEVQMNNGNLHVCHMYETYFG
jgi:hypothetical protein